MEREATTASRIQQLGGSARLSKQGGQLLGVAVMAALAVMAVRETVSDPTAFATIMLNGLTLGGLYFLVASGFTLVFGVMRVVNMAHGSFYLLGGYIGWAVYTSTGSWLLAAALAAVSIGVVGSVLQQAILRRLHGQDLREALVTIGLSIIAADLIIAVWGGRIRSLDRPAWAASSIEFAGIIYPLYRLAVLGLAVAVGLGLWAFLQRTRAGRVMRASVDDRQMVSAVGINVEWVYGGVFALGAFLAGFAGVAGGTFIALSPGEDGRFLLVSLIVVIFGGMGSLAGTAISAAVVGIVDQFASVYHPTYSVLYIFAVMVVVLAVRPQGLFGRDG